MAEESELLLEVNDLKMHFPIQKGILRRTTGYVKAVDGVSLSIKKGETLGLVGESGCGKTTTGRCIVRVYQPTDGEIIFYDEGKAVHLNRLERQELKAFRRNMQMIFQDPFSSLNPRMTVLELVGEPLLAHGIARGQELEDRVAAMVAAVGLRVEHLPRYPHSFSGGQRQRIGIARALVQRPKLVVCDEPVSALDVSVQSQVVNLLQDLQADLDLTYLFVAHDMSDRAPDQQPDRGDVCRQTGGGSGIGGAAAQSQASLQRNAAFGRAATQSTPRHAAPKPGRRTGRPGERAVRVRIPPALPLHGGRLHDRCAGADRAEAGPPRRLSFCRPAGPAGYRVRGIGTVLRTNVVSKQDETKGRSWQNW